MQKNKKYICKCIFSLSIRRRNIATKQKAENLLVYEIGKWKNMQI